MVERMEKMRQEELMELRELKGIRKATEEMIKARKRIEERKVDKADIESGGSGVCERREDGVWQKRDR